jgi:hypothetical protein
MNAQTSLTPIVAFMTTDTRPVEPAQVCSRDYGFDVDEEEIVRAMLAPVPASLSTLLTCEPGEDESENTQLWFLS